MSESTHSFHIPVMGTAFTIDTPIKVGKYGISSVISLVDDALIEKVRRFYCAMIGEEYVPIGKEEQDSRARRITAYLDLVDRLVREQFEKVKDSAFEVGSDICKYFEMLPDNSALKEAYRAMQEMTSPTEKSEAQEELRRRMCPGSIEVNIMTKIDGNNGDLGGDPPPPEASLALAALRGYANSALTSAIEFSAGFNARLYSYVERFKDFHADEYGRIKKKIILKVNDFRSALTQGKFLAKKSLWVSEYRVESGLNCGGHAFGNGGSLMGPVLEEFKREKDRLVSELFELYNAARRQKGKTTFDQPHPVKITAQGGIGTALEQELLIQHYQVDATGWGTPFLLVPEATTTDPETREQLRRATAKDLYLSEVSPMGVPFNNLRTSPSELAKREMAGPHKPGYVCRKGYLRTNTEFTEHPICVAPRFFQQKKLEQLATQDLAPEVLQAEVAKLQSKTCLCNDLAGAAILAHELQEGDEPPTPPAVCPGPNLAYFSKIVSLDEMVDHIYGRGNILNGTPRPHMLMAELRMVIDCFQEEIQKSLPNPGGVRIKQLREFERTLEDGIRYYHSFIREMARSNSQDYSQMAADLEASEAALHKLIGQYPELFESGN